MNYASELITELIPDVYEDARQRLRLSSFTDMSRSNRCDMLTLSLFEALDNRGISTRRELHVATNGNWHYLIAHAAADAVPKPSDIITDLTPWQWPESDLEYNDFLRGPRELMQNVLAQAGAPEWFVSLRGIATITKAHTVDPTPFARA